MEPYQPVPTILIFKKSKLAKLVALKLEPAHIRRIVLEITGHCILNKLQSFEKKKKTGDDGDDDMVVVVMVMMMWWW